MLEKDLSRYEAIYPENQQPVGKIKDFDIYLRSSVHRLDGAINWMKQLRSIKVINQSCEIRSKTCLFHFLKLYFNFGMLQPGEKPYKIVQKRSGNRASSEYGGPKTVDLYGRWQTIPYITPKIVDVKILYYLLMEKDERGNDSQYSITIRTCNRNFEPYTSCH